MTYDKDAVKLDAVKTEASYLDAMKAAVIDALEDIKGFDINPAQIDVLYTIFAAHKIQMKELAMLMQTTPGATTQIINGLVTKGYLERKQDTNDKRIINLQFTKNGLKLFKRFLKCHTQLLMKAVECINDEELESTIAIQQKLLIHCRKNKFRV